MAGPSRSPAAIVAVVPGAARLDGLA